MSSCELLRSFASSMSVSRIQILLLLLRAVFWHPEMYLIIVYKHQRVNIPIVKEYLGEKPLKYMLPLC